MLALLGGIPVRPAFPEPRPRLSLEEARTTAAVLRAPDWSRCGDDWPLPAVDELEERWAGVHGAAHAIAVSSGTEGLRLVLEALRLPAGDEILIPAYGCPAVDVAVLRAGLVPVHVDIDPRTYCLSPSGAAAALTARTRALIAVHFAGQPAGLEPLARLAERAGIHLLEDACLAPGAAAQGAPDGRPAGARGAAGVFSLGVRKPVTAGEGGLVTTNDARLAERLRSARSLGADPETGDISRPGGNHRLTALQAAVVLPQLERLEADIERRKAAAARIATALAGSPVFRLLEPDPRATRSAWAQLWLRYDEEAGGVPRARVVAAVQAEGIPLFPGWTRPNYALQVYTPARVLDWLPAAAGRAPDHYERTRCPHAERAAFGEALLLDFPLLDAEPDAIADAAEALRKVSERIADLRAGNTHHGDTETRRERTDQR